MNSTVFEYIPLAHGRLDGWIMRAALLFVSRDQPLEGDVFEIVTPPKMLPTVLGITGLLAEPPKIYADDRIGTPFAVIRRAGDEFRRGKIEKND